MLSCLSEPGGYLLFNPVKPGDNQVMKLNMRSTEILSSDLLLFLKTSLNKCKTQVTRDSNGAELPHSVCRF